MLYILPTIGRYVSFGGCFCIKVSNCPGEKLSTNMGGVELSAVSNWPLKAQPKWCVFESHRTKCNFWKWTRSPEGRSSGDENKSHLSKQVCWSIEQKHKDKKLTFYFRYFVKMLSIFYPYWHLYSEQDPRSRLGKIDKEIFFLIGVLSVVFVY